MTIRASSSTDSEVSYQAVLSNGGQQGLIDSSVDNSSYALELVSHICNNNHDLSSIDEPLWKFYKTLEEEPEKDRRIRLQLRHRFYSANAVQMPAVAFARKLVETWGGELIEQPEQPAPKSTYINHTPDRDDHPLDLDIMEALLDDDSHMLFSTEDLEEDLNAAEHHQHQHQPHMDAFDVDDFFDHETLAAHSVPGLQTTIHSSDSTMASNGISSNGAARNKRKRKASPKAREPVVAEEMFLPGPEPEEFIVPEPEPAARAPKKKTLPKKKKAAPKKKSVPSKKEAAPKKPATEPAPGPSPEELEPEPEPAPPKKKRGPPKERGTTTTAVSKKSSPKKKAAPKKKASTPKKKIPRRHVEPLAKQVHAGHGRGGGRMKMFTWDDRMIQLADYKELFGHIKIPTVRRDPYYNLGLWLAAQRSLYRKNNLRKERLSDLRKLGCIGFGGPGG